MYTSAPEGSLVIFAAQKFAYTGWISRPIRTVINTEAVAIITRSRDTFIIIRITMRLI